MNYEDDELERMRARREQRRREAQRSGSRRESTGRSTLQGRTEIGREKSRTGSGADALRTGRSSAGRTVSAKNGSHRSGSYKKGDRQAAAKKRKRRLLLAEIAALLILIVVAIGCYFYQKTFGSLQKIEFNEEEVKNLDLSEEQLEVMKGYWNVACFGVDSRMENGKLNVGKGTNADVNLIASVNLETGEIRLVSAFRDTYLNVNDKNSYNKLNYAYAQGGPEQAVKALNKNLGLNITQYATFNWKAVADAINILGGVDIQLSENEFSWINAFITETVNETGIGSHQLTHAGDVHLDGVQAVAYGRLRLGDTDYARTERQRIILQKAFEKAKKADWATLNCIIETIMPQLATNISPTDLIPLARNITKYHIGETAGFPSARGEMNVGKLGDCVIPQTLEFNVRELHKFLFGDEDYQVPSNVKAYSDHIASVTGLSTEGKVIGHVPVDQGVNASSYIKRKQQKAAAAAESAAASKAAEETTQEETEESEETEPETDEDGNLIFVPETDENGDPIGELFDPEEFDDLDWENGWDDADESSGPAGSSRPASGLTPDGSSDKINSTDKINNSDKTNNSNKTNNSDKSSVFDKLGPNQSAVDPDANGPAAGAELETKTETKDGSSSGTVITKPGNLTDPSGSTVRPVESTQQPAKSTEASESTEKSGKTTNSPESAEKSGKTTESPEPSGKNTETAADSKVPAGGGVQTVQEGPIGPGA